MHGLIERMDECPLCNGKNFRSLVCPGNWIGKDIFAPLNQKIGLCMCNDCKLVFNNPRPGPEIRERFYSGEQYSCHTPTYSTHLKGAARHLHKTMSRHLHDKARPPLLDYGCGGGGILHYLREFGWDGQGFEVGQAGVNSCRSLGLPVISDLDALPRGHFQAVLLNHVFEHLADPLDALRKIAPLLNKDGRLFISTPNAASLRARLSHHLCSRHLKFDERYRAFPIHLFHYTHKTLPAMIRAAGFQIQETITYGLGLENLFLREDKPAKGLEAEPNAVRATGPRQGFMSSGGVVSAAKNAVKNTLFSRDLGDSVMVVACV